MFKKLRDMYRMAEILREHDVRLTNQDQLIKELGERYVTLENAYSKLYNMLDEIKSDLHMFAVEMKNEQKKTLPKGHNFLGGLFSGFFK